MISSRNLDLYQGDDFTHTITLYDTDGTLFDFGVEHSFSGKIREAGKTTLDPAGPVLATMDVDINSPGEVVLSIPSEETTVIPPGRHWYEIRMIIDQPDEEPDYVITLFSGLAVVHPEVTKDDE